MSINSWNATGALNTGRSGYDGCLLQNGKVLLTCGVAQTPSDTIVSTCELYDPIAETWSFTGSLSVARFFHNVVTLQNGKVLLIGGATDFSSTVTNICELYDPNLGTWSLTGSLSVARGQPGVWLLNNGKVLVAGGNVSGSPTSSLATCEIYDPNTGLWTSTGSLNISRQVAGTSLLSNGNPIIICGNHNGGFTQTAEVYDVGMGTWTQTSGNPTFVFVYGGGNTTLTLTNGKVLSAGGNGLTASLANCQLYDPNTDNFTNTGSFTIGRAEFGMYTLPNGDILVSGGDNSPSSVTNTTEIYSVTNGTWSSGNSLNTGRATGQESHGILLDNGDLLWAGGSNTINVFSSSERFQVSSGVSVKQKASTNLLF